MKKIQLFLCFLIGVPLLAALWYKKDAAPKVVEDQVVFHQYLSQYQLFEGDLSQLIPAAGIEVIDIQAPLFTDYTEKQRLLKLPEHQKARLTGDGLLQFPEGTLLAKTFYYPETAQNQGRRLLETRLLIKQKSTWIARTYQWTQTQDEAVLIEAGAVVPVAFIDAHAKVRQVNYKIPTTADCRSCHQVGNQLLPIGFKARNMNRKVHRAGEEVNQLTYLQDQGKLIHSTITAISSAVNYEDPGQPIEQRVRSYLEVNCAHCHNPHGMAKSVNLDFRLETPFHHTGIWTKTGKIAARMSVMGEKHMPKLGTTVLHDEAVELILQYIKQLN
ncbi:hypothetical protein [Myroides sp. DF42-4-2]|uniref:hypothetical protein n=1 Tax=unclassified Myroides TaxID=2642485 RepID=UPI002578E6BA|nr:hypothetical protein [Myroides sp. DF42-4-2]MDM1407068.1 hypothetical protein [Myroides sp. DF42-4-2]